MSALAGCIGGLTGSSGPTVTMTGDLRFDPAEVTIESGETVTWQNEGGAPHTASAYEDSIPEDAAYFASGGYESEQAVRQSTSARGFLERGETYQYTFEVTGSYRYFCLPHEENGMIGTVIVE
jgi:plastocyanin